MKTQSRQVEDGDAGEEPGIVGIQVGQQQSDQPVVQCAALDRERGDLGVWVVARSDDRQRELQAQRPAFGQLVQPGGVVVVQPLAETLAHQLKRFGKLEAQQRRTDGHALPVGDEVLDVEPAVAAAATTTRRLGGVLRSR